MLLCITFENESIPFLLSEATEEECLQAINKAKENFSFNRERAVVESDRIILHAYPKAARPGKRLYCLNNKVILQTDTKCEDEKEPTRVLLACERNVPIEKIQIIEV